MLKSFYKSPALRTAAVFGVGGAAFSIGNLLLARVLAPQEYGLVSLVIGLVSLAASIAPLGIDYVVTRRGLRLGSHLRRVALAASLLVGLITVIVGALLYGLPVSLLICLFVATAAGGVVQVTSAHFQSQRQFSISVALVQASNWVLVVAGILTIMATATTSTFPAATLATSGLATAVVGWILVAQRTADAEPLAKPAGLWGEAIPLVTMHAATSTFLQLERLVIPAVLGINELALLGVLAALVGSPFRMIQHSVAFTLIPRLREVETIGARRQLLRREGLLVVVVLLLGSVLLWMLAPYIAHVLLAGRYELSDSLMLATLVSGVLKVLSAFATATASTLAPARSLRMLSIGSWACVGVAITASFAAARWGLVGVLYAISIGWLIRCVLTSWIALPYLRQSVAIRS